MAARVLLCGVIAGSALAIGTLHTTVLCVVTALLGVCAVLAWFRAEPFRGRPAATIVLAVGVALTAYTLFQSVPLPAGLVAVIAPQTADVWARSLMPLHEAGPAFVTLSLDPIATRIEVLRGVAYVLMFLASLRVCSSRVGAGTLAGAVVVTAIVVGIAAVLHPAFGVVKVYGMYAPGDGLSARHVAPLLNPNHLAAYLNVGYCLALGAALAPATRVPRVLSAAAVVILAGIQVWVASRGGVGAMVLGSLLVVWFSRVAKREGRATRARGWTWAVPAALCVASVVIMVLTTSDALKELTETDMSKMDLIRRSFRMALDFPIFGVGRGAFESAFPVYRGGHGHGLFTNPENMVAQWASEWGLPAALAALAALAFALRPMSMRTRSFNAIGAWVAIAVAAIHNQVDFSSEVPGVVVALVVCVAIVTGGSGGTRATTRAGRWGGAPNAVAIVGAVAAVGAVVLVQPGIGNELGDERVAMRTRALDRGLAAPEFHAAVRAAMLRHPAEPYMPFAGAVRASRVRDESVMPWIERTFERAAIYPPAHLILARALVVQSPAQARLEYRLAFEESRWLGLFAIPEATRVVGSFDDAMEIVPATSDALDALEQIEKNLASRLPATASRVNAEILRRKPESVPALTWALGAVMDDLRAGESAPWCEPPAGRAHCVRLATALSDRTRLLAPQSLDVQALHASLLIEVGDAHRGLDDLSSACEQVDARVDCLMKLATLARSVKDEPRATAALDRLAHAGCSTEAECVRIYSFAADAELNRGNVSTALSLYKKALAESPDDASLLEAIATLASRLGLHAEALANYNRLAQLKPADARWAEAMTREKAATVSELHKL
jgi:tetratricopeptide (TPR) repeat protein